jgi:uncharacterized protein YecE (DUF72 family)
MPPLYLGTSAFTAAGWVGSFYPDGMKSHDFLSYYAEHFDSVEVDSTFYRTPSAHTVSAWASKTPAGFVFSVKVPQVITHEKILGDCDDELSNFLNTMDLLGEKLGPMVFQFPFFNRSLFKTHSDFHDRFIPFLKKLPPDRKFAVEIRNKTWLTPEFADILRQHRVALVLQDQSWMPHPSELSRRFDPVTADWTYIRWLGDRKGIEKITQTWDKVVVDRTEQMNGWVDVCYQIQKRGMVVYAYANNHYAGHGPATVEMFRALWNAKGLPELSSPHPVRQKYSLFD